MSRAFRPVVASFLATALVTASLTAGGCTTLTPGAEVTRFHRLDAAAMPRGVYRFAAAAPAPMPAAEGTALPTASLEQRSYEAAVAQQLDRLGFVPIVASNANRASYAVTVRVDRTAQAATARRSPVSVGVGGSTGSYGSGVGLGVGINLGGGPGSQIVTRLSVRIDREGEALALWEGRAQQVAGARTPAAQPGIAAARLAEALFAGFPGTSGQTITVP